MEDAFGCRKTNHENVARVAVAAGVDPVHDQDHDAAPVAANRGHEAGDADLLPGLSLVHDRSRALDLNLRSNATTERVDPEAGLRTTKKPLDPDPEIVRAIDQETGHVTDQGTGLATGQDQRTDHDLDQETEGPDQKTGRPVALDPDLVLVRDRRLTKRWPAVDPVPDRVNVKTEKWTTSEETPHRIRN